MSTQSKATFSVGVSVLIVREGKLLLGRRQNTSTADGLLSTPGGRLEMDEDRFGCAIREAKEEAGIEIEREDLFPLGFQELFRYGKHYFMFYMLACRFRGEIVNMEPSKCEGWDWYDLDDIPNSTEPQEIIDLAKTICH